MRKGPQDWAAAWGAEVCGRRRHRRVRAPDGRWGDHRALRFLLVSEVVAGTLKSFWLLQPQLGTQRLTFLQLHGSPVPTSIWAQTLFSLWCCRDKGWDGAPKTLLMVWWSESPESPQPQPSHTTKSWEQCLVSWLGPQWNSSLRRAETQTHWTSPELTSCWRRCPLVWTEWGLALGVSPTCCTL